MPLLVRLHGVNKERSERKNNAAIRPPKMKLQKNLVFVGHVEENIKILASGVESDSSFFAATDLSICPECVNNPSNENLLDTIHPSPELNSGQGNTENQGPNRQPCSIFSLGSRDLEDQDGFMERSSSQEVDSVPSTIRWKKEHSILVVESPDSESVIITDVVMTAME